MELQYPKKEDKALTKGEPYMAFVKVTPYYEAGNPKPVMLRFNELVHRQEKPKEDKQEADLISNVGGEKLL